MNDAALRVGSAEVVAALALFAVLAALPRTRRAQESEVVPLRVVLDVRERGAEPRRFEGASPLIVGRSSRSGLVVLDPEVSRLHARFDAQDRVLYVSDLGSSNGTFLNGRRLDGAIEVRPGDTIDLGATRLTVVEGRPWH